MGKFCPNFRPHSHSKRSVFKAEQHIKILKTTQDAEMIGGQDISPVSTPIFTGGLKKQMLPNFIILGVLVSKRSNGSKI